MSKTWVTSDQHYGHANILRFDPPRPFTSVEEMNETMVERYNDVVRDGDTVYFLGDVAISRRSLPIIGRLPGRKILIKGNHDIFKPTDYLAVFKDIRAYKVLPASGAILSHIPVHPDQLAGRFSLNIHGHTHFRNLADARYVNVCVEQTGYAPVLLQDILDRRGLPAL